MIGGRLEIGSWNAFTEFSKEYSEINCGEVILELDGKRVCIESECELLVTTEDINE